MVSQYESKIISWLSQHMSANLSARL
ncbi:MULTISPECIES: hypothetical protein [Providencia]